MTLLKLALLALLLETIRLVWLARFPAHPDFLLGMAVVVGLASGPHVGAGTGLALGLFRDLVYGAPPGTEAFPLALIGWLVGFLGRSVYREAPITRGTVLFIAGVLKGGMVYLILRSGDVEGLLPFTLRITLPASLLTALLVPWGLSRYERRFRTRRRSRVRVPRAGDETILLTER